KIRERPTLSEVYTEQLILSGDLTAAEHEALVEKFQAKLQGALEEVKSGPPPATGMNGFSGTWRALAPLYSHTPVATGTSRETLEAIAASMHRVPGQFAVHPKIPRLLDQRYEEVTKGQPIDWPLAELLAFGSLLLEGTPVRLSGQDSRRGTFSQRHAVLYDAKTGEPFSPLNALGKGAAPFWVYDSLLSAAAVRGFE